MKEVYEEWKKNNLMPKKIIKTKKEIPHKTSKENSIDLGLNDYEDETPCIKNLDELF